MGRFAPGGVHERWQFAAEGVQTRCAMMRHAQCMAHQRRNRPMNNIATGAAACVLAAGAALGAWRAGAMGPQYADVLRATPVTVQEPLYVDVLDVAVVSAPGQHPSAIRAYDVAYRLGNRMHSARVHEPPGDQIRVGERRRVIGYDVVWRYRDRTGVARLNGFPGTRLPVVDGAIVEASRSPLAGRG
jgi:uncharacterized protein YcfJ